MYKVLLVERQMQPSLVSPRADGLLATQPGRPDCHQRVFKAAVQELGF